MHYSIALCSKLYSFALRPILLCVSSNIALLFELYYSRDKAIFLGFPSFIAPKYDLLGLQMQHIGYPHIHPLVCAFTAGDFGGQLWVCVAKVHDARPFAPPYPPAYPRRILRFIPRRLK